MLQEQRLEGLSEREAVAQRGRGHGNDRTQQTGRTYWQFVREVVFPLVNTILYVLCIALLLLGQISEGLISFAVVLLNVLISIIQEVRAKRLLDRITLLTRPKATVIRDGQERGVDPHELVLGDLLTAQAGDQIVVDGPVVSNARLEVCSLSSFNELTQFHVTMTQGHTHCISRGKSKFFRLTTLFVFVYANVSVKALCSALRRGSEMRKLLP